MNIDVTRAKRRFGKTPRNQWQFQITGDNGEPIDPRDTYANWNDILTVFTKLRQQDVTLRVHHTDDPQDIEEISL